MSAVCVTPATLPAVTGPRRTAPVRRAAPALAPRSVPLGWLERLALWAEAQPPHRRLGSWTLPA